MVTLEVELVVGVREQSDRELARGFLVGVKVKRALPFRRLNQRHRDAAARDDGFNRSDCAGIFERGSDTLLWERTGALDTGEVGVVNLDPVAQFNRVNA